MAATWRTRQPKRAGPQAHAAPGLAGGSRVREGSNDQEDPERFGEPVVSEATTIIGGPASPYVRKVMAVCDLKGVAFASSRAASMYPTFTSIPSR